MDFTGERYIPEEFSTDEHMTKMHMDRYKFALPFIRNKSVIDIACGEGYGSNSFAETANRVVGIDIDTATIEHAVKKYKKNNLFFYVGSVEKIPEKNESADIVVSFETIEHVNHKTQKKFIQEVWRVLKPGGIFIVSTPDTDVGGEGHNEFHVCELNKPLFLKMLSVHFPTVEFYGQDIKNYGNNFSLLVARILHKLVKLDSLKLRHKIFPKKFRLSIDTNISNSAVNKEIIREDAFIPKKIGRNETAAFLIAVCYKK